jgi:hypothetical protein
LIIRTPKRPVAEHRSFATKSVLQAFSGLQLLQKLLAIVDLFAASFARILPSEALPVLGFGS